MIHRFALFLLPVCVAIAQDATPTVTRTWGAQAGPWRLSISADKREYSVGETIKVVAVLKNVSDRPALFSTTGATLYTKDVRLPMPEWIPWKPRAEALPLLEEQNRNVMGRKGGGVPPGWEQAMPHELDKLFDMSTPGEYHIMFSTEQATNTVPEGQATHQNSVVSVTSNEITITVVAGRIE